MTEMAKDVAAIDVTDLLTRYSFELSDSTLDRLVDKWLNRYPIRWIRLAVIEALYQGRYKAISVEQILNLWQRRGKALHHFNHEFERVICGRFPYTQFSTFPTSGSRSAATARPYTKPLSQSIPKPIASQPAQGTVPSPPTLPEVEDEPSVAEAVPDSNSFAASADSDLAWAGDSDRNLGEDANSTPLQTSPVSSSSTSMYQPADGLEVESLVTLNNARTPLYRQPIQPIHHFVPSSESDDFYVKLRAVAQGTSLVNAD